MKKISLLIIILLGSISPSCDLERLPYDSMPEDEILANPEAALPSLVTGCYVQLKSWADMMHRSGEYAGDNIMIRGASTDSFYEFISYSRTPNNDRLTNYWNFSYKIIAQSSNIIRMVPEGKNAQIDNKLGECYFLRGMMYFYLCRTFGRPYYQQPDKNLGVPIVNGTPDDVLQTILPDRATVKDTYAQAISDLNKASELLTINSGNISATRTAAYALLSRIYLYMSGTYANPNSNYAQLAINYADSVINSGKYTLLPRATFMKYNTIIPEQNPETILAVKRLPSEYSGGDHYSGIGGMYANIGGMGWAEIYASAKYIDLLNETGRNNWAKGQIVDARAAFIEPQYEDDAPTVFRFIRKAINNQGPYSYVFVQAPVVRGLLTSNPVCNDGTRDFVLSPVSVEQGVFSIHYSDGGVYTGVIDKRMKVNRVYPMFYINKCSREGEESHLHSPVIISLSEVYLNKSEAAAKLGKYAEALQALNTIRTRSLPNAAYNELNSNDAAIRIDKERQLELAFRAERTYDIYRNGNTLTRHFPGAHNATEDIPATDFRVCFYIPQAAINAHPGTLTQNPTSN